MKYEKVQMLTEVRAMNVRASVTLQQFFDPIDLLCACLAGIDETTSETAIVLNVYSSLLQRPEWANCIALMASGVLD